MRLLLGLILTSGLLFAEFPPGISGQWKGTFNGQPTELKPDGSYPETVSRFELQLVIRGSSLQGTLKVIGNPGITAPIQHATCDPEGCFFEVIDNLDHEIMTWRVEPMGNEMKGSRGRGRINPSGIIPGARIFRLRALRVAH